MRIGFCKEGEMITWKRLYTNLEFEADRFERNMWIRIMLFIIRVTFRLRLPGKRQAHTMIHEYCSGFVWLEIRIMAVMGIIDIGINIPVWYWIERKK